MFNTLKQHFSGKKVFLTGHTGFKGAWLAKILSMLGAEVKGYSLAPIGREPNLYQVINVKTYCDSVMGDIRNRELLLNCIADFQPDIVFHLAAQPLVRASYELPAETFEINAIGTANVLDAVRALPGRCDAVIITTDKVYHNNEWIYPYRENDRLGGYDPYSASKACTELVVDSYINSFFNKENFNHHGKSVAIARAGNVIGGGDWAVDRLLPDIVRALSKKSKISVRNPVSIRPWQHVLEPLIGYLMLAVHINNNPTATRQIYNLGPHLTDALTVLEMVELAISFWPGEYEILNLSGQPHEAGLLKLDITKAITELRWKPRYNAKIAVEKTIEWYKEYYSIPAGIEKYTEKQILDYLTI